MADKDDLPSLESLRQKIGKAKGISPDEAAANASQGGGESDAWRMISELVAGIVVGGFLGYHADNWLQTRPFLLIAGLLLGMAGGIMNIYKASMRESKRAEAESHKDAH